MENKSKNLKIWETAAFSPDQGIGTKLRSLYNSLRDDEIPENLMKLLNELDKAEKSK